MTNVTEKYYFFLGVGGIGMSALARFLRMQGYNVVGYDAVRSQITKSLEETGINIFYQDKTEFLPKKMTPTNTVVIITPAIKQGKLLDFFQAQNFKILKRAQLLGQIANGHKLIAIAGTHGKTSTTALVSHILYGAGLLKAGFVGGIVNNYDSNLILPPQPSSNGYIVVEADEYDKSFLELHPDIAVITSIDSDHLDIYQNIENIKHTFEQFIKGGKEKAQVIINERISITVPTNLKKYNYGLGENSNFRASEITMTNYKQQFRLHLQNNAIDTFITFPGIAYLENSVAAAAAAYLAGVEPSTIKEQLQTYPGTKRRFEIRYWSNGKIIIDDYAHHPSEIAALYDSIKTFSPEKKLTIVFQPHLFSRTRDFAQKFAQVLDKFDEPIITDIYPAREKPIAGISPQTILDKMTNKEKKYISKQELVEHLADREFDILLIVGAGDINQIIEPLRAKLETR